MLPFEKALDTVLKSARPLGAERVGLAEAANRVLAEDVKSDMDIPPFNKSAMDGYACRRADLADELRLIETIPAGYTPAKSVGPGQCAKIMTGGVVPEGADCVVMKEYIETPAENTVRFVGEGTKDNVCQKGEDIKAGDVVLCKGTVLKPHHIAVLASVGSAGPMVAKMPRVGIIATGNELVDP
ncbi:MAG: molybdopterin molybdotransferase MoeA, partial [Planctomycetota bacterium]